MNQQIHRLGRKTFYRLAITLGKALQKMASQQRDIFPPLPQRWYFNRHHIQAIVEILAKTPGIHLCGKIAMGRRNQPDINRDNLVATDTLNFALLNRTQQTHLHHRRDIANFIEKQRAAVRLNKAPFPAFIGSSKRPFFVTEQFRFQQGFVECRTVERYQRFFATCATGVNRPGDQLFTGAGIAVDQHRGFRWRDECDFTEQVLHRRAFTDHTELAGRHRRRFSVNTVRMRKRLFQRRLQVIEIQRLDEIIQRPGFQRLYRRLDAGVRGHNQYRNCRI